MKISHLNMDAESICSGENPIFLSFIHSAPMYNNLICTVPAPLSLKSELWFRFRLQLLHEHICDIWIFFIKDSFVRYLVYYRYLLWLEYFLTWIDACLASFYPNHLAQHNLYSKKPVLRSLEQFVMMAPASGGNLITAPPTPCSSSAKLTETLKYFFLLWT